jgi:signal transduction histidine kinase
MIRVQSLRNRIIWQFVLIIVPLAAVPLIQTVFNLQRTAFLENSFRLRQLSLSATDAYGRFIEGVTDAVDTGELAQARVAALDTVLSALADQKRLDADHNLDATVEQLTSIATTVRKDPSFTALQPLRLVVNQVDRDLDSNRDYYEKQHEASIARVIAGANAQDWIVVGATLISVFLAAFFVRGMILDLTRPLTEAIRTANRIARGDEVGLDQVRTHPDIGGLLYSLKQMNASLHDYRKRVRDHERTLEAKIAERTVQLGRSVARLRALTEVTQTINSTLDIENVLATIVQRAVQLAEASVGTIYELEETSGKLVLRAVTGISNDILEKLRATTLHVGEGASGRAVATGAPVAFTDVDDPHDPYESPVRDFAKRENLRALLALPLVREGRVLGALTLGRRETGAFSQEAIELLQTFAAHSTVAMQNARLFRVLEEKSRELEAASQHKSQFLANMSHELRTPLNAILGYTELVVDQIYGTVPPKILDVMQRVQKSGRHLLSLINDVLDLSKIEAGQLHLALKDYSLADTLSTVVTSIEPLATEKGLELTLEVEPDLPVGFGDDRRLAQVLLNLLGNAVKFTDQGSVKVGASRCDGEFFVSVADTGPGIPKSEQERIFGEFQQVDSSSTRSKGGTGLGLAIAKKIVEMHGGRLWLDSEQGSGSTFYFSVPVRAQRRTEAQWAI